MLKHLRIHSVKDIEQALWIVYKRLPYPKGAPAQALARLFPYLSAIIAGYLLSIATLPFFFKDFILDPLRAADLFFFNIILSRLLFALMGGIILVSFHKLTHRSLVGWYNMFYLSLFHVFFVLVVFNPYSFGLLLLFWYILFAIKPLYT